MKETLFYLKLELRIVCIIENRKCISYYTVRQEIDEI